MAEVTISFSPRWYQKPVIEWFRKGKKHAFEVWARKSGKDRVATFIESELAFQRPGLYWHALPKYEEARKYVWDAIMLDGQRLVEWAFPKSICKHLDHEMKVILPNGSIWQPVGADNYDGLVGALPVHITWSEFALMSPVARNFLRQGLAMAQGTELIITTPRGYNHAYDLWERARSSPDVWHTSLVTAADAGAITAEVLAEEKRDMPGELYEQEYECSWSAANVGAILGRYVEEAEKQGRIHDGIEYDPLGAPLEISSDLGRRHVSAFWFWQPRVDGFALIDYDEESGLDAEEWIDRLQKRIGKRPLGKIWLPHDARAKTFSAKHSAVEYFLAAFGPERVDIVPRSALKSHSINAGQVVLRHCHFARTPCAGGLAALRSWAYEFDDERKQYGKNPVDDWAADGADAFCEGAKVMERRVIAPKVDGRPKAVIVGDVPEGMLQASLNDMWKEHERGPSRRARI